MQGIDLIIGAPVEATAVTASVKPQGMQKNEYWLWWSLDIERSLQPVAGAVAIGG